ncbi:hypothetical protein Tco_1220756 [Tanacetum coccineum]
MYHSSIKAAPFEHFMSKSVRSPCLLNEVEMFNYETKIILESTEKIVQILLRMQGCQQNVKGSNAKRSIILYIGPFKSLNRFDSRHINLELLKSTEIKELRLDDTLNFVEEPVEIMDREVKQLKQSRIPIVKVRWNSKRGPEFT